MGRITLSCYLFTFSFLVILCSCQSGKEEGSIVEQDNIDKYLQVPSPDWEDQIIYFIVTDRFNDGDSTNNDQGAGEYKRGHGGYWNGGDLTGITQKIDYIKELGATGIWITPPVANQWVNPQKTGTGNHGYWASSFVEVDKHLGTLDDYKQLSATLHKNGMYLIQDVVVNHFGDFYSYSGQYNPQDVTQNFLIHDVPQPTQYPFMHNDARKSEDLEMGIYHFAPNFHDHSDTIKKRAYQFADLDDLNTENPVVRKALRKSFNYWIDEVGVDGYRFDTPHMVEHDFWYDFLHSTDPTEPGILNFAKSLGKDEFITPGEVAIFPMHYDHGGTLEAAKYLGTRRKPEMNSILNFPLTLSIGRVFSELKPTNTLTFRLNSIQQAFPRPELLFNFIDNHDGARFLTKTDKQSFKQALLFILTIPGVPVIYYGTEHELLGMRQAMFKGGVGSPDTDHFITNSESFAFVQNLIILRKENELFRRGKLNVLRDDLSGPGIFIYELTYNGQSAVVMMNTSDDTKIVDDLPTHFNKNSVIKSHFSLDGLSRNYEIDRRGNLSTMLAPKAAEIIIEEVREPIVASIQGAISIDHLLDEKVSVDFLQISGKYAEVGKVDVSIDGGYEQLYPADLINDSSWTCKIPMSNYVNGRHRLTAFYAAENGRIISDFKEFDLELPEFPVAQIDDQSNDDHGPSGTYLYPTHESFSQQMDIKKVDVYSIGNNLKLKVQMSEITRVWLPPNGFDHVSFNIFIDLPDKNGIQALPFQNFRFPDEGAWDLWFSSGGFSNDSFSSLGAGPTETGARHGQTPLISVKEELNEITFFIAAGALNYPSDLSGTKIYINTWEGGPANPRALNVEPGTWSFGGGKESDPKIMDDVKVISIP